MDKLLRQIQKRVGRQLTQAEIDFYHAIKKGKNKEFKDVPIRSAFKQYEQLLKQVKGSEDGAK